MFGRKKKVRRDEQVADWESLVDMLMGFGGATHRDDGSLSMTVNFKREKRKTDVFVHCAEVSPVGEVIYFTAPIVYPASPENIAQGLDMVENLLEGGLVISEGSLVLRTTKPLSMLNYSDIVRVIERLAVAADEFSKELS